jgi:hypothetical protein
VLAAALLFSGFMHDLQAAPVVVKTGSGKLFFDSFNRTAIGAGYVPEGFAATGWSIVNNRLRFTSAPGYGQAYLRNTQFSYTGEAIYDFVVSNSSNNIAVPRFAAQKAAGENGAHYLFHTGHGLATVVERMGNGSATLIRQPFAYSSGTNYRLKVKVGAQGTNTAAAWLNEAATGTGTDSNPLAGGNVSFHVGNFGAGATVEYDNVAVYKSTVLTVNGTLGSWALYRNDGITRIGPCNTTASANYATITSFPADYSSGPAAQIRVFPAGSTACSGASAILAGSAGNEIFGGDVFTYGESGSDITPPVRSNGKPSGTLPAGTTQVTLTLTTNENATCRYGTQPGVSFGSMTSIFSRTVACPYRIRFGSGLTHVLHTLSGSGGERQHG